MMRARRACAVVSILLACATGGDGLPRGTIQLCSGVSALLVFTNSANVVALEETSGRPLWRRRLGATRPIAVVPCGDAFVMTMSSRDGGFVEAVHGRSGRVLWMNKTGADQGGVTGGPACCPGAMPRVLVGYSTGQLQLLDLASGRELWRTRVDAAPIVLTATSTTFFSGSPGGHFVAGDLTTGSHFWWHRNSGNGSVLLDPESVILPGEDGSVFRLGREDGRELWRTKLSGTVRSSSPQGDLERIYIATNPADGSSNLARVYALDRRTGRVLWEVAEGNRTFSVRLEGRHLNFTVVLSGPLWAEPEIRNSSH